MQDDLYMGMALEQAKKAYKNGDVPVGAIIVLNGIVISKAYNKKNKKNNAIMHAEIIAIEKACKKLKTWYLNECTLYVTLEPCLMCCGAVLQSRINKVVYGTKCDKFGFAGSIDNVLLNSKNNHRVDLISGICSDESSLLLKKFFSEKRKRF